MASRERFRTTVPVSSRAEAAGQEPRRRPKPQRLSLIGVGVLVAVALVILIAIAVPLRNYYQGRSEIARLNESIASMEDEKQRLEDEIVRYSDEDYVRQEARRRLGVIGEGETAYRIVDPRMQDSGTLTTDAAEEEAATPWYETLWDSIAVSPM